MLYVLSIPALLYTPIASSPIMYLHVLAHHCNHEIEQTDSLNESETQNGVGEELSSHAWVAGNSVEQSSEHHSNTNTGTSETDGCGSHTEVLGDLDHGGRDFGGEGADGLAAHDVTGGGLEDRGSLLTLHGLEGVGSDAG